LVPVWVVCERLVAVAVA